MDKIKQRIIRDEIGLPCMHEFRQLIFRPKYISRDFEVIFYCIYCLGITEQKGVNELQELSNSTPTIKGRIS